MIQPGAVAPDPDFVNSGGQCFFIVFPRGVQLVQTYLIPGDLRQHPAVFRLFFQQLEIHVQRFFLMPAGREIPA